MDDDYNSGVGSGSVSGSGSGYGSTVEDEEEEEWSANQNLKDFFDEFDEEDYEFQSKHVFDFGNIRIQDNDDDEATWIATLAKIQKRYRSPSEEKEGGEREQETGTEKEKEKGKEKGKEDLEKQQASTDENECEAKSGWIPFITQSASSLFTKATTTTCKVKSSVEHILPAAIVFGDRVFQSASEISHDVSSHWWKKFLQSKFIHRRHLLNTMASSTSYEQYATAALQLDKLEGNNAWKMTFESNDYDCELIYNRLEDLRTARRSNDVGRMMYLLRAGLLRNLGGLGNKKLFTYTHIGTKALIEHYIEEVVFQLNYICDVEVEGVTLKEKIMFFNETRHSFGRSALLLSGGGALGMYHGGVLKALYELQLLPRIVSGSSVGSIMAAVLCCSPENRLLELLDPANVNVNAFDPVGTKWPLLSKLMSLIYNGYLCEVSLLEECIKSNIGACTFQEAFFLTGKVLNITVNSTQEFEGPRLLNYLTAPNVVVYSAVVASCALKGLFAPVELMAKDTFGNLVPWNPPGSQWSDGSVESDLPIARVSELFNVNHFIVSQVNPHVAPFLHGESRIRKIFPVAQDLLVSEVRHRIRQLSLMGFDSKLVSNIQSVMSQKYTGDITLVPRIRKRDYLNIANNPTAEYLLHAQKIGQLTVWKNVSIIRNHCDIELALDRIVTRLRERTFSQHQEPPFSPGGALSARRPSTEGFANEKKLNSSLHPNVHDIHRHSLI